MREESASQSTCSGAANNLQLWSTMSSEKSVIIVRPTPKHLCPICGKAAYSLGGIHPQCAIQQADEPRIVRLRAARAIESKVKKPPQEKWKKRCPICGLNHTPAAKSANADIGLADAKVQLCFQKPTLPCSTYFGHTWSHLVKCSASMAYGSTNTENRYVI